MDNGMIQQLAASGLGELNIPSADIESLGTNSQIVSEACEILDAQSGDIESLIQELEINKAQLLANWEGQTAENFAQSFPKLIEAFREVPPAVKSVSTFAMEVCEGYLKLDGIN